MFFQLSQAEAVQLGDLAPACNARLMSAEQQVLDLNIYRGKVVLLDFWATWCPPCKKSIPFFNTLQTKMGAQGLEIIAVNVDENIQDVYRFLQQFPVNYKVALDPVGDCPEKYQVKAMPSSYFIDKHGKVRKIHLGFRNKDKADIKQMLETLLGEQ
ncbi:MAG: TlpA disulfide reductase family protein [Methylococcales bacterium]